MLSPALAWAAVELGGMVSAWAARWNEYRAGEYVNGAQAYLQQAEPVLRQNRALVLDVVRQNAGIAYENCFKHVEQHYGGQLSGLTMLLPPEVPPYLQQHVLPRLSAIETLSESHSNHNAMPGIYRQVNGFLPANTPTAALLFGLAESIDGLMQSRGMKLSARQYYEECVRMVTEADSALQQAALAVDAFFEMLSEYDSLAQAAMECVGARLEWGAMDEAKRLAVQQCYGLYAVTAHFYEHVTNVLEGRGKGA
jgi:hypothetical protein